MNSEVPLQNRFWSNVRDLLSRTAVSRFLIAVSGGSDSVCLFHLLNDTRMELPFEWGVLHLNHGLRGEQSAGDEVFVRDLAARYQKVFFSRSVDASALARQQGVSVEVAARRARRSFFESAARSFNVDAVMLAHHADDQAETVLLRMLRSSGLRGWGGMRDCVALAHGSSVALLRPLLPFHKRELVAYLRAQGAQWREDDSNARAVYERNRIRLEVLPELERINPTAREQLLVFAERCRAEYQRLIARLAPEQFARVEDGMCVLKIAVLRELNVYARHAVFEYAVERVDASLFPLFREAIEQFDRLMSGAIGKGGFDISSSCVVWLEGDEVCVGSPQCRLGTVPDLGEFVLLGEKETVNLSDGSTLKCEILDAQQIRRESVLHANRWVEYVDADQACFPLLVRRWRDGDRFVPLGMTGSKKLQDYFVDSKIDRRARALAWVVCRGNQVVWLVGQRLDDRCKIMPQTRRAAKLTFYPANLRKSAFSSR